MNKFQKFSIDSEVTFDHEFEIGELGEDKGTILGYWGFPTAFYYIVNVDPKKHNGNKAIVVLSSNIHQSSNYWNRDLG